MAFCHSLPTVDGNQKSGDHQLSPGETTIIFSWVLIYLRWLFGISDPSTLWIGLDCVFLIGSSRRGKVAILNPIKCG